MKKYRNLLLLLVLAIGMAISCYAQNNPPPPQKAVDRGPPCAPPGLVNENPNRPTIPPPVGLCLPIDDYVYFLMGIGVMYGCYKLRDFNVS